MRRYPLLCPFLRRPGKAPLLAWAAAEKWFSSARSRSFILFINGLEQTANRRLTK